MLEGHANNKKQWQGHGELRCLVRAKQHTQKLARPAVTVGFGRAISMEMTGVTSWDSYPPRRVEELTSGDCGDSAVRTIEQKMATDAGALQRICAETELTNKYSRTLEGNNRVDRSRTCMVDDCACENAD